MENPTLRRQTDGEEPLTRRVTTTGLALLALAVAGCGSSSKSSSGSGAGSTATGTGAATTPATTPAATSTTTTTTAAGGADVVAFKAAFKSYEKQSAPIGPAFGKALTTASKKTNSQIASDFGALATRVAATGAEVRKLPAPAQYSAQVSKLAGNFDIVAADLANISHDATVGDASSAQKATVKVIKDVTALRAVDAQLRKALGLPPG